MKIETRRTETTVTLSAPAQTFIGKKPVTVTIAILTRNGAIALIGISESDKLKQQRVFSTRGLSNHNPSVICAVERLESVRSTAHNRLDIRNELVHNLSG